MGTKPKRPNFPPLPLMRGEKMIEEEPDQSQLTKRYTEEAIKFIRDEQTTSRSSSTCRTR